MIKLFIAYFGACLLGLFIQSSFIHATFPSAVAPDIILILTVVLGLRYRTVLALCGAFILGLLADFASGQFLGPNAAGGVVAFLVVGMIAHRVFADKLVALVLITLISSLAKSVSLVVMISLYVPASVLQQQTFVMIALEAALTAVVAPIVVMWFPWGQGTSPAKTASGTGSFRWSAQGR